MQLNRAKNYPIWKIYNQHESRQSYKINVHLDEN